MFGIAAFLVSKELYVLEHNFFNGVSIAATSAVGMKTIGPHIAAHADKRIELIEKQYKDIHKEAIRQYEEAIILEKHEQWRAEGQLLLLDAKRKSVAIQLEAEYRERVMDAYNKVKQHLDWELEQERVIRALAHKHMVQWVRSEVGHTIVSSAFEKRFIKQCIEELTSIAQTKETFLQGGSESSNYKL
ncbi:hypothetical protein R5R35_000994 [Gryllus longicercus]|uniref:ATP synthase subunit b n=1 Tax=Gryllus longicercus TaxID=2509291 RepID=A0AAN9VWX2_9ORTH